MRLIPLLALCLLGTGASAQSLFSLRSQVDSRRETFYFTSAEEALNQALPGDTLLLPPGDINTASPLIINKNLTVIGTGHRPNSAVLPTRIVGDLVLGAGADNSYLSGFICEGKLQFGQNGSSSVKNIEIIRCRLNQVWLSPCEEGTCGSVSEGLIFKENVLGKVSGSSTGAFFVQNFLCGTISNVLLGSFTNNVFCYDGSETIFNNVQGGGRKSIVANNIFLTPNLWGKNCRNLDFRNNVFTFDFTLAGSGNVETSSRENAISENIFEKYLGKTFNYDAGYNIKSGSIARSAGINGTDVGVFGTHPEMKAGKPFKSDMSPDAPQIFNHNVGLFPDANRKLQVSLDIKSEKNIKFLKYWFENRPEDTQPLEIASPGVLNNVNLTLPDLGKPGTVKIHFQLIDSDNQYGSVFSTEFQNFIKPDIGFTSDVQQICPGKSVRFTNLSRFAKNYHWDFGNGITSTEENPLVTFENSGKYTVKLTAEHVQNGTIDTKTEFSYIEVSEPERPSLSVSRDTIICGEHYVLRVKNPQSSTLYSWKKNGIVVKESYFSFAEINENGSYLLESRDDKGCVSLSDELKIEFFYLKRLSFEGDTILCAEQSLVLKPEEYSFPAGTVFNWSLNGQKTEGMPVQQLTVSDAGVYQLMLTHPTLPCTVKKTAFIKRNNVNFTQESQEITFCIGGIECLTVEDLMKGQKIEWLKEGTLIPSEKGTTFCTAEAGIYTARLIAPNGCTTEAKPAMLYSKPVIREKSGFLAILGNFNKIQWFVNNLPLPGANSAELQTRMNGNYTVKVTDLCGTEAVSEPYQFTFTNRNDSENLNKVKIYPNPVNDFLHIEGVEEGSAITLFNIEGKAVNDLQSGANFIDSQKLSSGVYLLQVVSPVRTVSYYKVVKL